MRSGFEPWLGTLCCVLGQDTLLSQCLSPPRCINGYLLFGWGNLTKLRGSDLRWTSIPSRGSRNTSSRILAGYYVFYANILFTFQAIKNLSAHLTYLCFGLFWKFLVIFRYIWREIVFLKELVKLMEIGNFEDLLLF